MSKKTAIDAKRGTFFWLSPSDPRLKIVGVDVRTGQEKPDGPEHPLYQDRAFRKIPEDRLLNYRYYGIQEPITVQVDGDDYLVVDGRGRTIGGRLVEAQQKAAGEATTILLKVIVAKVPDEDLYGLAEALNIHDVDDTLAHAKSCQRMMNMGSSLEKIAMTKGVSQQTIRNWLGLLSAAPEVIAAVKAGEATPTVAVQLATLPKVDQVVVLAELKEDAKKTGGKITVEKANAKAREKAGKAPAQTPKAKLDRIGGILRKLSTASQTKEELLSALDKISRLACGVAFEKLGDE